MIPAEIEFWFLQCSSSDEGEFQMDAKNLWTAPNRRGTGACPQLTHNKAIGKCDHRCNWKHKKAKQQGTKQPFKQSENKLRCTKGCAPASLVLGREAASPWWPVLSPGTQRWLSHLVTPQGLWHGGGCPPPLCHPVPWQLLAAGSKQSHTTLVSSVKGICHVLLAYKSI